MNALKTKVKVQVLLRRTLRRDAINEAGFEYLTVPEDSGGFPNDDAASQCRAIHVAAITEKKPRLLKIVLAFSLIVCYKISIVS